MLLSETVGSQAGADFLGTLFERQSMAVSEAAAQRELILELKRTGLVFEAGGTLYLSRRGRECWWLLYAINSGRLAETVRQLTKLLPHLVPYELVTEGMTRRFIEDLRENCDFKRLLVCSPWISLDLGALRTLSAALLRAQEINSSVEFVVITRPIEGKDAFAMKCGATLDALRRMGAEVVFRGRLHAKLYLRERSARGGTSQAVFGSENLTGAKNLELGIRINNDTAVIRQLCRYFFELYIGADAAS
jgi:hypothetical protein